jgi:hypothetical protein
MHLENGNGSDGLHWRVKADQMGVSLPDSVEGFIESFVSC